MARAIPGTADILAIYGSRSPRAIQFAQQRERPHPLATLESVITSPITNLATAAISRGIDEYDYYQRKTAEEERVKSENQAQNERLGAIRTQRAEIESRLGAIPPEAIERARLYTGPGEAYGLGQIGTTQGPGPPGSPHGQFQVGTPIGGIAQPTEGGWGDYSFSNIQQMLSEAERLGAAEAQIGQMAQERFVPRTQQEFIMAMRQASPEERTKLIQQARAAVDVQPSSLIEAVGGTAGRKAQTAVAKGAAAYDAAVAKGAADEVEADRMERETQVKEGEHTSKDAKRQAEIKKIQAQTKKIGQEAKKLEKDLAKIGRRAKSGSALAKGHFTVMKMIGEYPGDKISDKIVTAFADKKFISDVEDALPKNAARVYVRVLKQHRTLLNKAGDSGGQDESKIIMSDGLTVKQGRRELVKFDDLLQKSDQQLVAAAVEMGLIDDSTNAKVAGETAAKMKIKLKAARKARQALIEAAKGGQGGAPGQAVDLNISEKFSRDDLLKLTK